MTIRRGVMTLFTAPDEPQSQRTRIIVAEKGIEIDIINVVPGKYPSDLMELNPYNSLPTLIDRDLVLYDSRVIIDYIDERFPHPPLMPVDPAQRAQLRLAMFRIERDWYSLIDRIDHSTDPKVQAQCKKELADGVLASSDIFKVKPFFLSDEFSVLDASLLPVLWRLKGFGVEVPASSQAMARYCATMFARPSFRASLGGSRTQRSMDW
jgi:stringent starvation protein A